MIGRFEAVDYDVLFDLHQKATPERYWLSPYLLRTHLESSPLLDFDASRWQTLSGGLKAFIAIKKSAAQLYSGPDPLTSHLGLMAFRDFKAGQELFDVVVDGLRSRGIQKLVFGQDNRHFFPGCPVDWPEMREFLERNGFAVLNEQVDLERDLTDYEPPVGVTDALAGDVIARPCQPADLPAVRAFFEGSFPGRWMYDAFQKWNLEGPETLMGLFEGETCIGFALIQQSGCHLPIGGAVWGKSLGDQWGSLGPIGVSESVRGRGLGDALLAASLLELKSRGARRTIIDWTTLESFYGKHGFQVARRYRSMVKDLSV